MSEVTEVIVTTKAELQQLISETVRQELRTELSQHKAKIADYMTLEQTAAMLNVHPATVTRAVKAGEIIAHNFGREKAFDKNNLFTGQGLKYTKYKKAGKETPALRNKENKNSHTQI